MRFFYGVHYIERNGQFIDPISVGIITEGGSEYYACNIECDLSGVLDSTTQSVLEQLPPKYYRTGLS